jgi:hypothetical protein
MTRHSKISALLALPILLAFADTAHAQDARDSEVRHFLPFAIGVQLGMGVPTGDLSCKPGAYLLPALEVQTRGRVFALAAAERLQAFGPVEDCLRLPSATELPDGRMLVKSVDTFDFTTRTSSGGLHFALGAGFRKTVRGNSGLSVRIKAGVARGQNEFQSEWVGTLGGNLDFNLSRHFVVSIDRRWFRLPQWQGYFTAAEWTGFVGEERPALTTTSYSWKRFNAVTFALLF